MSELKIVAKIVAKSEFNEEIKQVLSSLADGSRKEAGNISYQICVNTANPLCHIVLEHWKSQDAIDFHNATPHFIAFQNALEGKVDEVTIDVLKAEF